MSDAKKYEELASELTFVEKADGTGIQLWYCGDEALARHLLLMQTDADGTGKISHKKERDEDEHARFVRPLQCGAVAVD